MPEPVLHLASSSPRRREILEALAVPFTHGGVDIDETPRAGEPAADMVLRLATGKAQAAFGARGGTVPILGADTAVVLGERVFGKPAGRDEALEMLRCLSGRTHRVLTAVALIEGECVTSETSDSEVRFRDIHPDEAAAYWQSGEPAGKAGAYAIQGLGGAFVEAVSGSYSGVVGLPVFETARLLREAGIDLLTIAAGRRTD